MYNGLMKITQPTSMASTLQMNSQHMCIECWFCRGGGGGKLPNANCDQTTKWKYPNVPTTNDQFWGGG